jgi:hypothetical protein
MLRRPASASLRLVAAAALVAALLLLPAFNLPSLLPEPAGMEDSAAHLDHDHGHSHDDESYAPADAHGDHDHNVTDHTHDIPNALLAVAVAGTPAAPDWRSWGMTASRPKAGFRLERPPRLPPVA